jgi:hypothetical protein
MNKPKSLNFNTYNTRRNLPPEIGRKRGEANFLGAFERNLISKVFKTGYGGRNFSLANYGIADLIWFLPEKNRDSATLYAFETKLANWKRAFQQAYRYSFYSDVSCVVLPAQKSKPAVANIDLFELHGIGLWLFDKDSTIIEKVFTPFKSCARNPEVRQKVIDTLSAKVKFC